MHRVVHLLEHAVNADVHHLAMHSGDVLEKSISKISKRFLVRISRRFLHTQLPLDLLGKVLHPRHVAKDDDDEQGDVWRVDSEAATQYDDDDKDGDDGIDDFDSTDVWKAN